MTARSNGSGAADPADPILRALDAWLPAGPTSVLLAVSGGPDSMALMHAAACLPRRCPIHVATVDHGLRAGSAVEADTVAAAAAGLGFPHATLAWTGGRGRASAVQARAREARYRLLAAHAAALGAGAVLTGHNADDQAETVLMRLAAGSGPAGLAGMRDARTLAPGLRLVRPFLGLPKADLVAWCRLRGIAVVADPANAAPRFARARWRGLAPLLEAEGLTRTRLLRLAERAARDDEALARAAASALASARRPSPGSGARFDGAAIVALPEAVALRLVALALAEAGAGTIRLERLERLVLDGLLPALRDRRPLRRTLAGTVVDVAGDGTVRLAGEPPRTPLGRRVAGPGSLLGKGEAPAYIGVERSGRPEAPSRMPGAEGPERFRD